MITKALTPPVTVGMSPIEVVELYFTSINNFDHMTLEDTVTKEAGGRIVTEVTNLYVMARVRERYEGINPFVNAQQWLDAGKPPLDSTKPVYGVANINIQKEGHAEFIVEYEKWAPVNMNDPDPSAPLEYEGIRYKRRFILEERRNAWIISEIITLDEESVRE